MRDDPISREILRLGKDDSVVFVFPSDIAAKLWLAKSLELTGLGTLPAERFIAWDRFKETAARESVAGKSPVSSVVRKLYALALAERNAKAGEPLLREIIPEDYAKTGSVFASWIARALPQLGAWERKSRGSGRGRTTTPEAADLKFLKADYGAFLETHALFEPSWQAPRIKGDGNRYVIFFPETIEDFAEYSDVLAETDFVETVRALPDEGTAAYRAYPDTRAELSALALEIEALLRDGEPPENIAISVPDIETVGPYLRRELTLRAIPFEYRSGFNLGSLPSGRLFSLVARCVGSDFSFAPMKALLLDRSIPWKHRDLAADLVAFGVRNHCVSSWRENGKTVDVWEAAFAAPAQKEATDWRVADFYRALSRALRNMISATTFGEIRNRYFSFRNDFLDMGLLGQVEDATLARCVRELSGLAELERAYPDIAPKAPYSFFASVLAETPYVAQKARGGVSVFPYRVAAGTPFARHFVVDASQDAATVLYRGLPFLRKDRRDELGLNDEDASRAFFAAYRSCGATFSFAELSFAGYRTPHGFFEEARPPAISIADPYAEEKKYFSARAEGSGSLPIRAYPTQKDGVAAWSERPADGRRSYLETPFGGSCESLSERVASRQKTGAETRVTQTDLASFSGCRARWFLSKILGLEAETPDAELLNERNLGILYHDVLKKTYDRIRETDGAFNAKNLGAYREFAREFASAATPEHAEFQGPLAAPLLETLATRVFEGVAGMIDLDAEKLDGFVPDFLEGDFSFSRDGARYYGRVDRISRRPGDNLCVLVDYKSGKVPGTGDYLPDDEGRIRDFQIPMYISLAENADGSGKAALAIDGAWFGSIAEGKYRPIVNDNEEIPFSRVKGALTREEFEPAMRAFETACGSFVRGIADEDFTRPSDLADEVCYSCDFREICRWIYAVREP